MPIRSLQRQHAFYTKLMVCSDWKVLKNQTPIKCIIHAARNIFKNAIEPTMEESIYSHFFGTRKCRDKILQLLWLQCTCSLSPGILWSNPFWKPGPLDSLHSLVVLGPELLQVVFQGPGTQEKTMTLGPTVAQAYRLLCHVSIQVQTVQKCPKHTTEYHWLPR